MTYRTASYAEAKRSGAIKVDEVAVSQYRGATTKSQAFFRKMDESHTEADRLRLQCRAAANASAARNLEERVELQYIKNTIDEARAVSSYAQGATTEDAFSRMDKFTAAGAPMWLGHLADPKHWEQKEQTPKATPAILPGLSDTSPAEVRADYSQQISEAVTDGPRTNSKQRTKEAETGNGTKLPPVHTGDNSISEAAIPQDSPAPPVSGEARGIKEESASGRGSLGGTESERDLLDDSDEESQSDYEDSDASDPWPPSPPVLRFKMRMQFSDRFRPTDDEGTHLLEKMHQEMEEKSKENELHAKKVDNPSITWLNERLSMKVETEYHLEVGFPVIILTMLDAIYPKRVKWREVDWRFQYKRALQKNFGVLDSVWSEVNMEKAREFRVENTPLRLENMPTAAVSEKLEFLRLMKRWYDQRIHHAGPYDPMAKRQEFVDQCKAWGHKVKFPNWINFVKDHKVEISEEDAREQAKTQEYNKMPEYKRLIHFLGCQEYQTM